MVTKQTRKGSSQTMKIESLFDTTFLSGMMANPSGTMVAFSRVTIDRSADEYKKDIYLWQSSGVRRLTTSGKEGLYCWLNDDELLFQSKRQEKKGETCFYRINVHGGEATEAFSLLCPVGKIEVLKDDSYLVLVRNEIDEPDSILGTVSQRQAYLEAKEKTKEVYQIDQIPFYLDNVGMTYGYFWQLMRYDAKKRKLEKLTDDGLTVEGYYFDRDRQKILYWGNEVAEKQALFSNLYELDLNSGRQKQWLSTDDQEPIAVATAFYFNEQLLFFGTTMTSYGVNENLRLYGYVNERLTCLIDQDLDFGNSLATDSRYGHTRSIRVEKKAVYFVRTDRTKTIISRLDKEFKLDDFYVADGSVDDFWISNQQCMMIAMLDGLPQELYLNGKCITSFNRKKMAKKCLPIEHFEYQSNGDSLDGYVLLPPDYQQNKQYPAILEIHGGPKVAFSSIYYHEMQVLAHLGYVVFFTNPHGGSGRGNQFSDIFGRYGQEDYEDLMTFTDQVLKRYPAIDQQRLFVTGGSYGGYMTNWITSHTKRFTAAVTQRSICNWTSFYGTSDIGYYFATDQAKADTMATDGFSKLWQASPLAYVNQVSTPTLVIHSSADYRCPLEQGYQWFTALRDRGIDSRLLVFNGQSHELSRSGKPSLRQRRLEGMIDWFDKFR